MIFSDFCFCIYCSIFDILHFYCNTNVAIKLITALEMLLSFTSVDFCDFFLTFAYISLILYLIFYIFTTTQISR